MFPGANSTVYYNEAGEPLGWDDNSYDEPEYDDGGPTGHQMDHEDAWEAGHAAAQDGEPYEPIHTNPSLIRTYRSGYVDGGGTPPEED